MTRSTSGVAFTPEVAKIFLDVLRETGNISLSAKACKLTRQNVQQHRDRNPEFAKVWDDAYQDAMDKLEREAWRRAAEGTEKPQMFQGRQIGIIREYSDRMMEMLLMGGRPEKYAHKFRGEITGKGGTPLVPEVSMIEVARRLSYILTQAANSPIKVEYSPQEPEKEGGKAH